MGKKAQEESAFVPKNLNCSIKCFSDCFAMSQSLVRVDMYVVDAACDSSSIKEYSRFTMIRFYSTGKSIHSSAIF